MPFRRISCYHLDVKDYHASLWPDRIRAWGEHHARVIAATPDVQLVAVAARSEATRERARHGYPGTQTSADYRDLLARNDLDAVAVVLPSYLHFEVAQHSPPVWPPSAPRETHVPHLAGVRPT